MNTTRIIGIVLIITAILFTYLGVDNLNSGSASVEVMDIDISVTDESTKTKGYIYFGLAALFLISGLKAIGNRK